MIHAWLHRTAPRLFALAMIFALLLTNLPVRSNRVVATGSRAPVAAPQLSAFPDGFFEERIVAGLRLPTAFAVAADGRVFIAEKAGKVRVVEDGVLLDDPFIDLGSEVNDTSDRGMLGIAVHPNFPAQPYVYVSYTYDPPEVRRVYADSGARVARILRLEADPENLNVHKQGSGVVILGSNSTFERIGNPEEGDTEPFSCYEEDGSHVRDCIATEGTSHTTDFLKFGSDGALYVSVGDGIVNSKGNWRAQDPNSLNGKVLRINPITGDGYADNPWYDGDLKANRAKVWAMGLRNPFKFTFKPGTNELWIGEVGNMDWEELNVGTKGANFGWPCYEGHNQAADFDICQPLLDGTTEVTYGLVTYAHQATPPRGAIIGGDFYTGTKYPGAYRNSYFYTDFNGGIIWNLRIAADGSTTQTDFATSVPGPVQLTMGPDGYMWMLYIATGELVRLGYTSPTARPTATPTPRRSATVTTTGTDTATVAATVTASDKADAEPEEKVEAIPAAATSAASATLGTGQISREIWTGVAGNTLDALLDAPRFPNNPNKSETLTSLDAPRNGDKDYGQRIAGYLYAPLTGQYSFWIAADDAAQLSLSSDDNPANAVVIASAPQWTPLQVWDKYPEQASGLVQLEAGKRYYIEILHKQADGKDNLSVAWQPPGGTREIIAGKYLSPLE